MSKKAKIITAVLAALIVLLTAIAWILVSRCTNPNYKQGEIFEAVSDKPAGYNFDKLKKTYPDIVGWLDIPNTNISQPIVQSPNDDSFYLNHSDQQTFDINGALYMEMANKADFTDPVTVIYGHNMSDGSMFASIHNFRNKDFFDSTASFYIYTPGHKLTYNVFLAEITDDRHIINSHNFSDPQIVQKYFDDILSKKSISKNVRSDISLSQSDKIVQLSTCVSDTRNENQRYIVSGVLAQDQETM